MFNALTQTRNNKQSIFALNTPMWCTLHVKMDIMFSRQCIHQCMAFCDSFSDELPGYDNQNRVNAPKMSFNLYIVF